VGKDGIRDRKRKEKRSKRAGEKKSLLKKKGGAERDQDQSHGRKNCSAANEERLLNPRRAGGQRLMGCGRGNT